MIPHGLLLYCRCAWALRYTFHLIMVRSFFVLGIDDGRWGHKSVSRILWGECLNYNIVLFDLLSFFVCDF